MHRILTHTNHMLGALCLMASTVTVFTTVAFGETYTWEDIKVPFKQTFRFSINETPVVRVKIPHNILASSGRVSIFLDIEKTSGRLRPYMIVNNNRRALYYLGGNGIVNIRPDHLNEGENEFLFGDQTLTGDLIFIYEMRLVESRN